MSCASTGPKFSEISISSLPPDAGRIYIYRTTPLGFAVQPDVKLNGAVIGKAVPGGFFYVDKLPGNYEVSTLTEVDRKLSMTLNSGQVRYVRLDISLGFFIGHVYPVLVEDAVGKREIQECKYAGYGVAGIQSERAKSGNAPSPDKMPLRSESEQDETHPKKALAKENSKEQHEPNLLSKKSIDSQKNEVARDGRFIAYANHTVLDTKTNLMWAASDSGKMFSSHSDAKDYCQWYRGGGFENWRMPIIDELKSLYDKKSRNREGYHITPLIDLGNDYIWADNSYWGGETAFNFRLGSPADPAGTLYRGGNIEGYEGRALPVRTVD